VLDPPEIIAMIREEAEKIVAACEAENLLT